MIKNKKIFIKKFIICIGFFLSFFLSIFGLKTYASVLPNETYGGVIWQDNISSVSSSSLSSSEYSFTGPFCTYSDINNPSSILTFDTIKFSISSGHIDSITYCNGNSVVLRYYDIMFAIDSAPFIWLTNENVYSLSELFDFFDSFTKVSTSGDNSAYYTSVGYVFGLNFNSDADLIQQLQLQITNLTVENETLQDNITELNSIVSQQNILIDSLKNQIKYSSKDIYAWNTISFAVLFPNSTSSTGFSYVFGTFNEYGSKQEKDLFTLDLHKFFVTKEIEMPTTAFGNGDYFRVHFYSSVPYNAIKYPIYYYPDDSSQYLSIYNLHGVGTIDLWPNDSIISTFTFESNVSSQFLIFNQDYEWNGLEIGVKSLEDGYNIKLSIGNLYSQGFDNGFLAGQNSNSEYINSLLNNIENLKNQNYDLLDRIDVLSKNKISFMNLFMGISNIPGNIMASMLNFEVLGINILGLVTGLLSALLLIWLIKKLI